ncbi:molecular chaperone DnaJ [Arcanobacterium wilhelmae]|uniref:Molecular chaperone DnaJ n=1 Tax=Arcanobacterium wilhelmae TaxID=1803177 RepID=A0ABT9NAF4_9ACTO|nr:J domain-containing protein [Arcanobacterium wilhelmae]MDP9800707.1 molecular chaperone DnaJ [Arcanobacterium wilhelmae]WFN90106.1 J domain-containing protein [Arcanobacterium wilhelmae]
MASQDWMNKDFYAALGVAKTATQDDIKKAYRKLARKYHPDQNPGDKAAEEKFKEVSEAFQVLSNEQDRTQYDAIRAMGGGARFSAGGGGAGFEDVFSSMFGGGGANPFGGNVKFGQGGAGGPGFEDVFSSMFGGGAGAGGFGGFGSRRREKGADVHASVSIPLSQAVSGTTVKVGSGLNQVTARIPAGVKSGQKIRIAGKGEPGRNGGAAGDILVEVTVEPHPVFDVKGYDVYIDVPVSFDEAALGGKVEVPTIAGTTVTIKVPAGLSDGKYQRVRGKGIAGPKGAHGDMYVKFHVVVPKRLSDEARAAVEQFRAATSEADPRATFRSMAAL